MAELQLLDCFQPELVNLERVHYFPRQLLTADDMVTEADYVRQKLRRHNRFLHGWGVVCGLEVTAAPIEGFPWRVKIDAGYALDGYGNEIYNGKAFFLDAAKCGSGATTNPCEPSILLTSVSATGGPVFVAIKYAECLAKPVRAMPAGCACEEEACEYSRIRDSFQIECLTELPPLPPTTLLCELREEKKLPLCPPCPTEPWVVLARVTLPESPSTPIPGSSIDNFVRRQLYSTTLLQEQLIHCCCDERPQPPPLLKVSSVQILTVNPNGTVVVRATLQNLTQPLVVTGEPPNAIQVEFNRLVDNSTVIDGQTFVVQGPDSATLFPGEIVNIPDTTVRWVGHNRLTPGKYSVTLVGNGGTGSPAITSTEGQRLDGEPTQLPSGDNKEGGNFSFVLTVLGIPA